MQYKRLEIYTWWKCNHRCLFCIEYQNMKIAWNKEVTKKDIFSKLLKYKKKGYNHVTFLWWEPFIHPILNYALKLAKKLQYKTLVTTNASILQFDKEAEKNLFYIDELILSIHTINKTLQTKLNRTTSPIDFNKVFKNIKKYWNGNFLKINIVINKFNLSWIEEVLDFLKTHNIKDISITYPDIIMPYYKKDYVLKNIAPSYNKIKQYINIWFDKAYKYSFNLILADIPFCILPKKEFIQYTDDYNYQTRLKIDHSNIEIDRKQDLPRRRKQVKACKICYYNNICWWPSLHYEELFWLNEIKPFKL